MMSNFLIFAKQVLSAWSKDRVPSMSAALSYYTLFSLVPILLICIGFAGYIFGSEEAQGRILGGMSDMIGHTTGKQIRIMIENANKAETSLSAQIFGVMILIFGASGIFLEIQRGLNRIWEVVPNSHQSWMELLMKRFLSFTMVFGFAFFLLVSMLLGVFLTAVGDHIARYIGIDAIQIFLSRIFYFCIDMFLFAMIFKILPDLKIRWKEVWLGAVITTCLFNLGKYLLGLYLNYAKISSSFGIAAGSIVILLIWVYYMSQIFFIGAEITKIFSTRQRKWALPQM